MPTFSGEHDRQASRPTTVTDPEYATQVEDTLDLNLMQSGSSVESSYNNKARDPAKKIATDSSFYIIGYSRQVINVN